MIRYNLYYIFWQKKDTVPISIETQHMFIYKFIYKYKNLPAEEH